MELLVAIIVGLLLGLYFHKRKAPMTVNTWFKGLFVMLIFVIIASGFSHIDDIKNAKEGAKEIDVYDIATESK
jgi:Na+/H+-dicarboxylate symporter